MYMAESRAFFLPRNILLLLTCPGAYKCVRKTFLSILQAAQSLASKMKIPGVEGIPGLIGGLVASSLIAKCCLDRACGVPARVRQAQNAGKSQYPWQKSVSVES